MHHFMVASVQYNVHLSLVTDQKAQFRSPSGVIANGSTSFSVGGTLSAILNERPRIPRSLLGSGLTAFPTYCRAAAIC